MKVESETRVRRGRIAVQKTGRRTKAFVSTGPKKETLTVKVEKAMARGRHVQKAPLKVKAFSLDSSTTIVRTPTGYVIKVGPVAVKKKMPKMGQGKIEHGMASAAHRARRPTKAEIEFFEKRNAAGLGVGLSDDGTLVKARKP